MSGNWPRANNMMNGSLGVPPIVKMIGKGQDRQPASNTMQGKRGSCVGHRFYTLRARLVSHRLRVFPCNPQCCCCHRHRQSRAQNILPAAPPTPMKLARPKSVGRVRSGSSLVSGSKLRETQEKGEEMALPRGTAALELSCRAPPCALTPAHITE